jgi:hypothetical protein
MIEITPDLVLKPAILNRVRANKNWLGVICGATGSGKSYWSLSMCETYFPNFDTNNIVFTINEWLKRFKEIYEDGRKGEIIVFDEGEDWNARRSMGTENVEFGKILAMIRFTNISSIFTLPDIRMIDVNLTRLMHNYMYVLDIDRKSPYTPAWQKTRSGAHFWEIVKEKLPDKESKKLMVRTPRVPILIRNNNTDEVYQKVIKIPKLWLNAPSPKLLDEYEQIKNKHFGRSLGKAMDRIQKAEDKERKKSGYFEDGHSDRNKIKSDQSHSQAISQILSSSPRPPPVA